MRLDRLFPQFFAYLAYFVFTLVAAATFFEVLARAASSAYRRIHPHPWPNPIAINPAISQYSWAADFHREQKVRLAAQLRSYVPFRVWGLTEWHGQYMNNDASEFGVIRRTINPRRPECGESAKTKIWIFGGSVVYGTGVPDSLTIPSFLSRELNATHCVEVTNFGVEGYVNNQELIALQDELKAGHHPDTVIFCDGFNDAFVGTIDPGIPGVHIGYSTLQALSEGTVIARLDFLRCSCAVQLATAVISNCFHRKARTLTTDAGLRAKAIATVDNFERNLSIVKALGKSLNFCVYAFWQPVVVYGHKPLAESEKLLVNGSSGPATAFQALIPAYQEAQRRAASVGDFVFLGDLFDAVQEPVYLDWVHLSPRGNELIARAIAEHISAHAGVPGQGKDNAFRN